MSLPPSYNLLAQYPNRYFIESGSYRGDAIQQALDAGFQQIRSMDIDKENVVFCHHRFDLYRGKYKNILVRQGDSSVDFFQLFGGVQEPITFWLDAHSQLFEDGIEMGNPFPLLKELEQIAWHPVKSHTILIDDILVLTHPDVTGWSRKTIEDAILAINPAYRFEYVANPVKNNLLIATI
jgi:hypothetical protein